MVTLFVRALVLALRARAAFPDIAPELVGQASVAAVLAETDAAPAELLVAIAEHESGLEPGAVSWRSVENPVDRVDILATSEAQIPAFGGACGLVSTMAPTRAACARLLAPLAAMRAGAAELGEHRRIRACGGSLRCALSSYAAGGSGIAAWQHHHQTTATAFADLFIRRAEQLGMEAPRS
jgi:transglycosylase-like protein with SLT domain